MVGAHYRGTGNLSAAIAVVTAMIEVMLDVGMETSRLKPSLLMLSSCHMDMARRLRAEAGIETADSKYHYDTACDHLRNVYGSFIPPSVDAATYSHAACALLPPACPDDTQPKRRQRTPAASPATSALRGQSPDSTPRYSHAKVLEREIRSLRDRQADQAEALSRTRELKRKVEDELETERQVRRRLERQLDRAEKDAIGAEKSERVALEQCRAEVETRRWAEERAEDMRRVAVDTRATLEPRLAEYGDWEGKVKGFLGKMGIVFLKAARGEFGEVLTGRA
ncbi:hypothetical protein BD413DRAFT_477109 [Trametes elegans]|nr:hypothetical protein BD413DRAFT_477109 [Trametes elegans]